MVLTLVAKYLRNCCIKSQCHILLGVDRILLGEKSMWMEDKSNHSLLFGSLPVQKFSLGVGSKGCFTSCPKHVSEMIWGGGSITKPKQNCKEYTNSSISVVSLAVILQNHRSLRLGGTFLQIVPGCPSAINRQLHPFLSSWRANFWVAQFFSFSPFPWDVNEQLGCWFLQEYQFLMLIL